MSRGRDPGHIRAPLACFVDRQIGGTESRVQLHPQSAEEVLVGVHRRSWGSSSFPREQAEGCLLLATNVAAETKRPPASTELQQQEGRDNRRASERCASLQLSLLVGGTLERIDRRTCCLPHPGWQRWSSITQLNRRRAPLSSCLSVRCEILACPCRGLGSGVLIPQGCCQDQASRKATVVFVEHGRDAGRS